MCFNNVANVSVCFDKEEKKQKNKNKTHAILTRLVFNPFMQKLFKNILRFLYGFITHVIKELESTIIMEKCKFMNKCISRFL